MGISAIEMSINNHTIFRWGNQNVKFQINGYNIKFSLSIWRYWHIILFYFPEKSRIQIKHSVRKLKWYINSEDTEKPFYDTQIRLDTCVQSNKIK